MLKQDLKIAGPGLEIVIAGEQGSKSPYPPTATELTTRVHLAKKSIRMSGGPKLCMQNLHLFDGEVGHRNAHAGAKCALWMQFGVCRL